MVIRARNIEVGCELKRGREWSEVVRVVKVQELVGIVVAGSDGQYPVVTVYGDTSLVVRERL